MSMSDISMSENATMDNAKNNMATALTTDVVRLIGIQGPQNIHGIIFSIMSPSQDTDGFASTHSDDCGNGDTPEAYFHSQIRIRRRRGSCFVMGTSSRVSDRISLMSWRGIHLGQVVDLFFRFRGQAPDRSPEPHLTKCLHELLNG